MKKVLTISLITMFNIFGSELTRKVAVFCSADNKASDSFKALANNLGKKIGENNFGLVTGGSKTGLMKEIIDGYLSTSNKSNNLYGIIPEVLKEYNVHHLNILPSNLIWVESMHKRLERFHELSDIIIVLPGGFGTLHELMDFLVAKQFSIMNKQIVLINYEHYWDSLLVLFDNMQNNNLLAPSHKNLFLIAQDEKDCIQKILSSSSIQNSGLSNYYWEDKK